MNLSIGDINLHDIKKFNIEKDGDTVIITVSIDNPHLLDKLYDNGIPVDGYEIMLNNILLGKFYLPLDFPIAFLQDMRELEFRGVID